MKRISVFYAAVIVAAQISCPVLWAEPTSAHQAQMVVRGWLRANPRPFGVSLGREIKMVETFSNQGGETVYYIVYLQPNGFVIVPADDLIEPIIGFADDGTYDPSPYNPLGALVTGDLTAQVQLVRSALGIEAAAQSRIVESQPKWERLVSLGEGTEKVGMKTGVSAVDSVRVAPLVQTKWAQTT